MIFLAFANSRHDPLPSLQEEDDAIYRALAPKALRQEILLHRDSFATLAKISEYITLFRNHLMIFHYSGHAGRDTLVLEEEMASSGGIAGMLKQCPNIKLVVLNGCSTKPQVQKLLANGVPVVIATSAPVEDMKAMRFGIRFYKALSDQASFKEAFELAISEVVALDGAMEKKVQRDVFLDLDEDLKLTDEPLWGIYTHEEQEGILSQTLSTKSITPELEDFEINERLLEALWESLSDYSDAIQMLMTKSRISVPRKRMAILNSLPAPVAEHLRKLMVPVEDENQGYDSFSVTRLKQIVRTYQTVMELVTFTLMAQLWETFFDQGKLDIVEERKANIRTFLRLQPSDQEVYDYLDLIRNLRDIIEQNQGHYFMEELKGLLDQIAEQGDFQNAAFFLEVLKVKLSRESVTEGELPELCRRAEESLAQLLSAMAFLSKYALVSVQGIDVRKYRHTPQATFNHIAVELRDLLGGLEVTEFDMKKFMDNQSILLLNDDDGSFLNLTPFIIDVNAFQEKTDVAKIFFVSHFDKAKNNYCFKPIYKPEKESEWIYLSDKKYAIVKKQFDAFKQLLA
jgi:hypothetical protein